MRRRVVTVHGISSDGKWQTRVDPVLAIFFKPVPVRYWQYRLATCLVVGFLVLSPAIAAAIVEGVTRWPWWVLALAAVLTTRPLEKALRSSARDLCKKELDAEDWFEAAPHVIAHSMGTRLTADLMQRYEDVEFDRMVLVGGVLPTSFEWKALHSEAKIRAVWNEVALSDWVVRVAYWVRAAFPGLGRSGIRGFDGDSTTVHLKPNINAPCTQCLHSGASVLIHDVTLKRYGHSDSLLSGKHTARYWVPFLLGIEPSEYRTFLNWCIHAARLYDAHDFYMLHIYVELLRRKSWRWAGGSLEQYLRRELLRRRPSLNGSAQLDAFIGDAIDHIWAGVGNALTELREDAPKEEIVVWLDLRIAAGRAVTAALM